MTKKATAFLILAGTLILWWAGPARADQPETFEPGTGKYILVLEDPRTEVDDPVTGKKKAREPDVRKHGGKVLHKKDSTRVIKLPTRAAGALRKEDNVAYLQRIWLGESREEWGEEAQASSLKTSGAAPETLDVNLTWETGTYLYDGSGNIKKIGADTYRYDTLGRLAQAVVKGITETYQYDSFGNLIAKSVNGQARAIPVDSSSNRLQGEAYDAAGNVTTQAGQPRYHYDSFSMVDRWERPPSNRKRYIYGPDDERIGVVLQEGSFSRWKIRDFGGKVLREFKADDTQGYWEWIEDYAYADGRLLAAERESYHGGKRHFHTDHLGSVRMITDQSRKRIAVHDYSAFGVEQTDSAQEYNRYAGAGGGGDFRAEPMKFTGHERDQHGWLNVDNDDSLDYMHARYYDPNLGRFLSVDPVLDIESARTNPQQWNRYSYAHNNPIGFTDPDGKQAVGMMASSSANYRLYQQGKISRAELESRERTKLIGFTVGLALAVGGPGAARWAWSLFLANPNAVYQGADVLSPQGSSTLPISSAEDIGRQLLDTTAEKVAGFGIFGLKRMDGSTLTREILEISADAKGRASIGGLFKAMEGEAMQAGASQLRIVGHAIINKKLLNPEIAQKFGYTYRQVDDDTIELIKDLK